MTDFTLFCSFNRFTPFSFTHNGVAANTIFRSAKTRSSRLYRRILPNVYPHRVLIQCPVSAHQIGQAGRPLLRRRCKLGSNGGNAAQKREIAGRIHHVCIARF